MAGDHNQVFLFKFEVSSDPQLLSVVRSAVRQLADLAGLSEQECRSITLAVDEALTNIIRHAYQNQVDRPIEISCRRIGAGGTAGPPDRLEFVLVDWGRSADPSEMHGRPLGQVQPGGLGLHFIRSAMDEVHYEPCGDHNCLRLVKYLSGKEPATPPKGEEQ